VAHQEQHREGGDEGAERDAQPLDLLEAQPGAFAQPDRTRERRAHERKRAQVAQVAAPQARAADDEQHRAEQEQRHGDELGRILVPEAVRRRDGGEPLRVVETQGRQPAGTRARSDARQRQAAHANVERVVLARVQQRRRQLQQQRRTASHDRRVAIQRLFVQAQRQVAAGALDIERERRTGRRRGAEAQAIPHRPGALRPRQRPFVGQAHRFGRGVRRKARRIACHGERAVEPARLVARLRRSADRADAERAAKQQQSPVARRPRAPAQTIRGTGIELHGSRLCRSALRRQCRFRTLAPS
jgi:hypothetical protein